MMLSFLIRRVSPFGAGGYCRSCAAKSSPFWSFCRLYPCVSPYELIFHKVIFVFILTNSKTLSMPHHSDGLPKLQESKEIPAPTGYRTGISISGGEKI